MGRHPHGEIIPATGSTPIDREERADLSEFTPHRVNAGGKLVLREQQLRPRVVQDVTPLCRREPVVERYRDHARLGRTQIEERVLDAVLREDPDTIPF